MNPVDPSALTAALAEANLAVLVSALAHLTGDLTLIDRYPDPRQFDHGRGPGTLPPAEAEAIRAEALVVLGEGLPGEAWSTRSLCWLSDLAAHPGFHRAFWTTRDGLDSHRHDERG